MAQKQQPQQTFQILEKIKLLKEHFNKTQVNFMINQRYLCDNADIAFQQNLSAFKSNSSAIFDIKEYLCEELISEYVPSTDLKSLKPHSIACLGNGRYYVTGYTINGGPNQIKKLNLQLIDALEQVQIKYYYKREQEEAIGGLKIMRDGTTVMIGMVSGNIVFCDFSTDKFIEKTNQKSIETHIDGLKEITCSPFDNKIGFGSDEKKIYVYDVYSQKSEVEMEGHNSEITSLDWHPYKSLIISSGKDQSIRLWDPQQKKNLISLIKHTSCVNNVKWNKQGNMFLSCGADQFVKLFDLRKFDKSHSSFKCLSEVKQIAWHPLNELIFASGEANGVLSQWIITNESSPVLSKQLSSNKIEDICYHPQGLWIGALKDNRNIQIMSKKLD